MQWLVGRPKKKKSKAKPKKAPRPEDGERESSQTEGLAASVRAKGQALVLLQEPPAALRGRLVVMGAQTVTVALYDVPEVAPGVGQVCCVQYHHESGSSVFLVPVVNFDTDDDGSYLTVQRPEQTLGLDARRAFRIPVEAGMLKVVLHVQGQAPLRADVEDVSRHGALVVGDHDPQSVPVGAEVELEFLRELDSGEVERVRAEARVVRHHPRGWGVAFATAATHVGDEALADLVSGFERDLLRRQRQTEATYQPLSRE